MSSSVLFKSSLAKKYWMSLTGLFLILFLVVHLAGNLQLIFGDQQAFNEYTEFMVTFPLIKITSYLLYASILLHVIDGFLLARQNRAARPVKYAKNNASANSSWASRSMALLGTITLIFLIIHMKSFWFEMKFGTMPVDENGLKDMWTITVSAFQQWWYTAFYVLAMIFLGFHLSHGFQSAFQTLGINHPKYTPAIKMIGAIYSIIIPALFAIIPIYVYFAIEI